MSLFLQIVAFTINLIILVFNVFVECYWFGIKLNEFFYLGVNFFQFCLLFLAFQCIVMSYKLVFINFPDDWQFFVVYLAVTQTNLMFAVDFVRELRLSLQV